MSSADNQCGVEANLWQQFGRLSIGEGLESATKDDVHSIEHLRPEKSTSFCRPRSKGLLGMGPDFDTAESKYFVVGHSIYSYDMSFMFYQIDQEYNLVPLYELESNPPLPRQPFTIEGLLFQMDSTMELCRQSDGQWRHEQTYEMIADACAVIPLAYTVFNSSTTSAPSYNTAKKIPPKPRNTLINSIEGLDRVRPAIVLPNLPIDDHTTLVTNQEGRFWPATEYHTAGNNSNYVFTALQPRWLQLGIIPSREEVDALVEAMKSERKLNEPGEGPPLNCPLPECSTARPLRRPQALRDHLYFRFGIKPFPCQISACDKAFETNANRNRHEESCPLRASTSYSSQL